MTFEPDAAPIEVSVVVPIYNEESIVVELCRRTVTQLQALGSDWERIFVDDGSTDQSNALIREQRAREPRIKIVELSTEFRLSKQSLGRLVRYALDGIVSFSFKALALGAFYFMTFFTMRKQITGFTTIIVCVLFIGGVQLVCVGILGEYIGRIYEEVKQRPLFIVKGRIGFD